MGTHAMLSPRHDDWFVWLLGGDSYYGTFRMIAYILAFIVMLATVFWWHLHGA